MVAQRTDPNEAVVVYRPAERLANLPTVSRYGKAHWNREEDAEWRAGYAKRMDQARDQLEADNWRCSCGVCPLCRWVDAHPGESPPPADQLGYEAELAALDGPTMTDDEIELAADMERLRNRPERGSIIDGRL